MNKIKFGVVGIGHIGKRHAAMIQQNQNAQLVAIADIDNDKQKEVDAPFYSSIEDLLQGEQNVEVINVCTPNGIHAEQTILSLKHGKHVVCEKPLALSTTDAQAMIDAEKASGKMIFGVVQNRYSPSVKLLRDVVSNNRLGKFYFVKIDCFWNRSDTYYDQSPWRGTLELDGGPAVYSIQSFY